MEGLLYPIRNTSPLSLVLISLPSYSPMSTKGVALHGEVMALMAKEAVELAPPSPGYYSRLFIF